MIKVLMEASRKTTEMHKNVGWNFWFLGFFVFKFRFQFISMTFSPKFGENVIKFREKLRQKQNTNEHKKLFIHKMFDVRCAICDVQGPLFRAFLAKNHSLNFIEFHFYQLQHQFFFFSSILTYTSLVIQAPSSNTSLSLIFIVLLWSTLHFHPIRTCSLLNR